MPAALRALAVAGVLFAVALAQTPAVRGFIGVALTDLPNGRGALVGKVQSAGPADKAGLKTGDIVVEVNGAPIDRSSTMIHIVSSLSPGATARIKVIRGNGASAAHLSLSAVVGSAASSGAGTTGAETSGLGVGTVLTPFSEHNSPGSSPAPPMLPAPSSARLDISGYTSFSDPLEQAFTIQVPSGWRTEGGLLRLGALQINPYVRTLSPDRMTYLMYGEPTLPGFAPATEIGMKLGFREGSLYSPGFGQRVLIWHYLRGPEFARVYGVMALGNLCRSPKFVSGQELPQLASTMNSLVPTVIPSSVSGGEAVFTCMHHGQEMTARVEAVTRITRDNVNWNVILLDAYIAPRGLANDAHTALTHILKSIEWSQAWVNKQNALSQQAAQAISARIAQQEGRQSSFLRSLNSVDENFQAMDDLINGVKPYKWIDDYGRIVSTWENIKPPFGYNFKPVPRPNQ